MNHYDPDDAMSDIQQSRASVTAEGVRPWPWAFVGALAVALLAVGAVIDLDMIWLTALIAVALAAVAVPRRAVLLPSAQTRRYAFVSVAVLVVAFIANVLVQLVIRDQEWQAPNTWGGVAAALVLAVLIRPTQRSVVRHAR